jgi:hypothetical protein
MKVKITQEELLDEITGLERAIIRALEEKALIDVRITQLVRQLVDAKIDLEKIQRKKR